MLEPVTLYYLFAAAIIYFQLQVTVRRFPRFAIAPTSAVDESILTAAPTESEAQVSYARRALFRTGASILIAATSVALAVITFSTPFAPVDADWIRQPIEILVCGVLIGHLAALTWTRYAAKRLVAARPELASSVPALKVTLLATFSLIGFLVILGFGFTQPVPLLPPEYGVFATSAVALVFLALMLRVVRAQAVKTQSVIDPESELGCAIHEMLSKAGRQPKQIARIRSLTASGVAYPNGVLVVTTMLAEICTPREVAAVLAHELSHALDQDVKKLRLARFASLSVAEVIFFVPLLALFSDHLVGSYFIAMLVSSMITLNTASLPLFARTSRRLEFKCDRYTAQLGYGPELSSALTKLHRVLNTGHRWVALDKWTVTHPSLDERRAAIAKLAAG